MKTHTPANNCPACNYNIDAASGIEEDIKPQNGDLSVCFNCGAFLIFNEDLTVSLLSQKSFSELDNQTKANMQIVQHEIKLSHESKS